MTDAGNLARAFALTALVALAACAGGGPGGAAPRANVPQTPDNIARERNQTPPIFDSNRGAPL